MARVPQEGLEADVPYWGISADGKFLIKTVYHMIFDISSLFADKKWSLTWSWLGAQRIRHFLWLLLRRGLLTSAERVRQHMADDPGCTICGCGIEDVNHVLRECHQVQALW